jgi:outer membrane protein assembly factor BamB
MNSNASYAITLALLAPFLTGADWLQFRGGDAGGTAADVQLPISWSAESGEHIAWKAPLTGKGVSGPIVVGNKVFVTASSGFTQDRLHVMCFDAASGKNLWERQFWATGRTICHPTSAVAAPTPASDGRRIFAFYSSNDLVCLDLDGNLLWYRGLSFDYPHAGNDVGMASSPVVVDETVIVQIENQDDSFAAGLDVATGETRWRQERTAAANWSSPIGIRGRDGTGGLVVLTSSKRATAYEAKSGKEVWTHDAGAGIPSAAASGEVVYVPGDSLKALRLNRGSLAVEELWDNNKLAPGNSSPVIYRDRAYVLNKAGVLTCGNIQDGEILWQVRLKGPFWSSPVIAGEHLYSFSQDGVSQVVRLGEKGEIVGENALGESILGTPAIGSNALFVRTEKHLWRISK